MPFEVDSETAIEVEVEVRPSAVQELSWLLYVVGEGKPLPSRRSTPAILEAAPALRQEFLALWGSETFCLPDLSILAERIGALLTDDADPFLAGLERAALADGAGLDLLSETTEDRELTLERMEKLRADRGLVRRYCRVLAQVWDLGRQEWEQVGRQSVQQACHVWAQELRQGARLQDLLPAKHILKKTEKGLGGLLEQRPRVVLSPMYFCHPRGGYVIDMTSFVHVGGPVDPELDEGLHRTESEQVANRLKVLSDGTRVALLRQLALAPASVMDLSRRFRLAQPTVSNHVRLLRDAGLLESQRDGARVVYTAPRERLGRLLAETQHVLLER